MAESSSQRTASSGEQAQTLGALNSIDRIAGGSLSAKPNLPHDAKIFPSAYAAFAPKQLL
jgi:hypothetical protein